MNSLFFCLIFAATLLLPLTSAEKQCKNATLESCGSSRRDPKTWVLTKTLGVKCHSKDEEQCLVRKYWCSVMAPDSHLLTPGDEICPNQENLKFENCLSVTFSHETNGKTIDYLWSSVETHWEIAEMFCESKGYNLLSFHSQEAADLLTKEMKKALKSTESFVESKDFTDKIGQHCWEDAFKDVEFWTGIYHDRENEKWSYTDGKEVSDVVIDRFSDLKRVLDETTSRDWKRVTWKPDSFTGYDVFNAKGYVAEVVNSKKKPKIQIICSKSNTSEPKKWDYGGKGFKSCITGFDCTSSDRCQVGTMLDGEYQKVMDGQKACGSGGEAEKYDSFPHAKVPTEDKKRQYIFFPVERTRAEIDEFCKLNNLKLPSVHAKADKQTLLDLADEFMKQKAGKDLATLSRNLSSIEWKVALVVRKSGKWDDGHKVGDEDFLGIPDWKAKVSSPSHDVHIELKSTGHASISTDPSHKFYIVCQTDYSGGGGGAVSGAGRPALLLAMVLALLLRL